MISNRLRVLVALCIAAALLLAPRLVVGAQDDGEPTESQTLEELKEEQRRAEREAALAASEIDVFNAEVEEVTQALDELAVFVDGHIARVESAEQAHRKTVEAVEAAESRIEEITLEQEVVRVHMTNLAVASFTGEQSALSNDLAQLALSDDPGESARFIHLLESQTGTLTDGLDRMRALEIEALQVVETMQQAESEAATALEAVEQRTAELEEALVLQEQLVVAAELRIEAQLAEAAVLQDRDSLLATQIADQQYAINERIIATARSQGIEIPPPVRLEDIVRIEFYDPDVLPEPTIDPETGEEKPALLPVDAEPFFAIEVNVAIEEQVRALYTEAFAAGIDLAGWGYRPIQRQIELRAAHCGGTEFDIWHKSASACSPPTARPGFSKHEQGRAVDFTFNGGSITSHANAGFQWLAANAPKYGFVNLASEPWHWSISEGDERFPGADSPVNDRPVVVESPAAAPVPAAPVATPTPDGQEPAPVAQAIADDFFAEGEVDLGDPAIAENPQAANDEDAPPAAEETNGEQPVASEPNVVGGEPTVAQDAAPANEEPAPTEPETPRAGAPEATEPESLADAEAGESAEGVDPA